MKPILPSVIAAVMLGGCQTVDEAPAATSGTAVLTLTSGVPAGTARLLVSGTEITLSISLTGLPEGLHEVHLDATGSCDPLGLPSAGQHPNFADRKHGFDNPQGAHLGDLPNVRIGASGAGTVSALLPGAAQDVISRIFDADGTAIIVHANEGDNQADPSGSSGERLACGVLRQG